jgi:hypothetical protein
VAILIATPGVHAENPKLIWDKPFTGEWKTKTCYSGICETKSTTFDCSISRISLSNDGKLIGYKKGNGCESSFIVLDSYGETTEIGEINYDSKGFIGDGNTIVATRSPSDLRTDVYFYGPNGTKIKEVKFNGKFVLSNLEISPNGEYITFVDAHKYISISDGDGNILSTIDYDGIGTISSSIISNKGNLAIFTSDGNRGFTSFYNKAGELLFRKNIEYPNGYVRVSPDGQRIVVVVTDVIKTFSGLIFFDNEGRELWRYNIWASSEIEGGINDIKIYYDGEYSTILTHNKLIEILDEKGEKVGNYSLNKTAGSVSVSEKGDYILISSTGYLYYLDNSVNIKPTIVVLANSMDYELNSDLFRFLENKGLRVTHTTAENFDKYKNEKFIVILGGPDAYEGIGEMVREVLMNNEQNQIRAKGSRKIYVKTNVWTHGQRVYVIAGSNRMETKNAVNDNNAQITVN